MTTLQRAFVNGFVKRAAAYGVNQVDAIELLKQANPLADLLKRDLATTVADKGIGLLGSIGTGALSSQLPIASQQQIDDVRLKLGIPESVTQNLSDVAQSPFSLKNNAAFDPADNNVRTFSLNMNKLPILAHEYGHANIHHNGGPVGFLQDNIYPYTGHIQAPINLGADMLLKKETNMGRGALIGAGAQAIGNMGRIIPEFEASRRALSTINEGATTQDKIKNTATLVPGFASYLGPVVGGGVRGALRAKQNQQGQQEQQSQQQK